MDTLGGLSLWHLIVIVIGSVISLLVILILCYCCKWKSRTNKSGKERKRYVYKYDPFTGKGNVAVIMEMSTSNGGVITLEQPEVTNKTMVDVDPPLKKDLSIERPRSQSFTEMRYVYRYNPASGEGSVERIPAYELLVPKKPKSSHSHNCLAVEMLEQQLYKKCGESKDLPVNVLQKLSKMGSDPRGIGDHGAKGGRPDTKQRGEHKVMKTRVGNKNRSVHHVLLSAANVKPPPSDCSDLSSPTGTEISRSTSELCKLQYERNNNHNNNNNGEELARAGASYKHSNSSQNRGPRASVGDIFPPSSRNRRKSSSRLGPLNNCHGRASESHIFSHRRKHSDSTSASVEGDDDCAYRTLSLTSLTQTMWQKEYETAAHESEAFIPEVKEVPENVDADGDDENRDNNGGADTTPTAGASPVTHADVHLVIPRAALVSKPAVYTPPQKTVIDPPSYTPLCG